MHDTPFHNNTTKISQTYGRIIKHLGDMMLVFTCNILLKFAASLLCLVALSGAQDFTGPQDPRLVKALTLQAPAVGVSTTPSGRLFLIYARVDGSTGPQIVEYHRNGSQIPYPNAEWNSYAAGKDPGTHFIRANAQRIGPDGNLYVVDIGSPNPADSVIFPDGPKLVQINITTNRVSRVYSMGNATRYNSNLDDVRFHLASGKAYLSDAGVPGLIILDIASGSTVRVLDNDPSTAASFPVSAEGHILYSSFTGKPAYIDSDQLEVSPDGKFLYYQPSEGGLSRIETKYLDQAFYNTSLAGAPLSAYVEPFALTSSTGGTAIDGDGNVYVSDIDSTRIVAVAPNGTKTTLVQDPRLTWVDAMWVDSQKRLWLPVPQLNRGEYYGNGRSNITKPIYVYTIDIGIGPSQIDHA